MGLCHSVTYGGHRFLPNHMSDVPPPRLFSDIRSRLGRPSIDCMYSPPPASSPLTIRHSPTRRSAPTSVCQRWEMVSSLETLWWLQDTFITRWHYWSLSWLPQPVLTSHSEDSSLFFHLLATSFPREPSHGGHKRRGSISVRWKAGDQWREEELFPESFQESFN